MKTFKPGQVVHVVNFTMAMTAFYEGQARVISGSRTVWYVRFPGEHDEYRRCGQHMHTSENDAQAQIDAWNRYRNRL